MISKYDLAKALYEQAKLVCANNGYLLIPEGQTYEPEPSATYVQEFVLYGEDTAPGLADDSSDIQLGIYQININTPKEKAGAKWIGLQMAETIQTGFKRGTELTYNGQMVRTKTTATLAMLPNETHEVHILSINFSVIN